MPSFSIPFHRYAGNKLLSFEILLGTVVRTRSTGPNPCFSESNLYDKYLLQFASNEIGCIPSYWKRLLHGLSDLRECVSQKQLQTAYDHIMHWPKLIDKYGIGPCDRISQSAVWNWQDLDKGQLQDYSLANGSRKEIVPIRFYYQDDYYQEIEYLPDLDVETLISNIGGFVGIFLGVSLMQIPDLIGNLICISIIIALKVFFI